MPFSRSRLSFAPIKSHRRGRSKQSLAKAGLYALKAVRKIRKQMNAEQKYHDQNLSGTNVDYSGVAYALNNPGQGDTDITRDGDSLKVLNSVIKFIITRNGADAYVRCIVFWDQGSRYSAATDILTNSGSALAPLSTRAHDTRFYFNTLYDKVVHVDTNKPEVMRTIKLNINKHTQFSAGSTTITTGVLRVLFISDQVTSNLPTVHMTSRVYFTDN